MITVALLPTLLNELRNLNPATATRAEALWASALLGLLAGATGYYPELAWVEQKLIELDAVAKTTA